MFVTTIVLLNQIYEPYYVFIISIISSFSLAVRDPLRSTMQNRVNQIKAVSLLDRSKGVALVEKWLTGEGGTIRLLTKQLGADADGMTALAFVRSVHLISDELVARQSANVHRLKFDLISRSRLATNRD